MSLNSFTALSAPQWLPVQSYLFWAATSLFVLVTAVVVLIRSSNQRMCKRSPLLDQLDPETEEEKAKAAKDLEAIFTERGLATLFRDVSANNQGLRILMSGTTGYVGKTVLFQMLRLVEQVGELHPDSKLVLLVRRRKNSTPADRLAKPLLMFGSVVVL